MFEVFLISLAVLALLSIVFEEVTHINKAKTTLFLGCIAWISLFISAAGTDKTPFIAAELNDNLLEIATLWLFLMSTMTFVAYLNAKGMIQLLVQKIFPQQVSVRMLMLQVGLFALVLSTFCDNVTATLVSLGLLTTFNLASRMRRRMAVLIIFAVNSGGVALITGDVTTLMIFLAGKVQMSQLLILFLPAGISVMLLALLFSLNAEGHVSTTPVDKQLNPIDIIIGLIFLVTIVLTMLFNILFDIPPVLTFLAGLSVMFLVGRTSHTKKEEIQILEYIRQVEFDTLLFFLGILLLVGMLKEIGTLELLTQAYGLYNPAISNYFAGVGSAILDNVPLTAALLKAEPVLTTAQWLGLTYSVGVGGSLLVIGSAAGIIAMSKIKELTFVSYLKYFPALLLCYSVGYGLTILIANQIHS
ncbi:MULTISPECIES: sodium:proton antiporter NhaD [unclassified Shewanella]|uniref:sodium:proton antiporter NhaD n=1 Tax=unclassified Shewanella TaxID=196818 RepID=UPI000C823A06|nr:MULTISPECIES: sodium:proton antiporter NhaD [unclassified Shewanella]MDO6638811.1 sodium:proton antiporter NhaD [Shewanella sp. 5_MG-2023]MDO6677166.1 sodium:proton antiporter NhaD [Shewanella sp. 4_MG-2023]MDO6773829.1 sodium:proton antiporter NhaD [Shewanella sp. 3_MG-2023]PMG31376.1 sodium:proton antiporter [Shewanella sp. 10N.286.52.C2]PMG43124.1 sodium:proton antiporter [Shewanella sp. 10N.286.52.B9]